MTTAPKDLPWRRIALWGFALNAFWEFAQCTVLYDMWDWGFWRATVWMWGAIFGDILIVLSVVALARLLTGTLHVLRMDRQAFGALLGVGLVAAVFLEWAAQVLDLWEYSSRMPTIDVLGREVGLSPILQVTLLPLLSTYLACKTFQTTGTSTL
ncbi:hypothetical protein AWN76_002455 [Rhodothermaceae bacterium RA]|nr:hypothetical protein AWN76_002455 [Rhodothermaceae bacterium RA]